MPNNICSICGQEVPPCNDMYFLTTEFLGQFSIKLGAPNFEHRHITPIHGCVGSPLHAKYMSNHQRDTSSPSDSKRISQWYEAAARLMRNI